ncbi:MAG TPA: hypothetical protein VM677_15730 [Actinokineospora sp.]|nr:hypothetical protein [Actinokineospora sp.]
MVTVTVNPDTPFTVVTTGAAMDFDNWYCGVAAAAAFTRGTPVDDDGADAVVDDDGSTPLGGLDEGDGEDVGDAEDGGGTAYDVVPDSRSTSTEMKTMTIRLWPLRILLGPVSLDMPELRSYADLCRGVPLPPNQQSTVAG